MHIDTLLQVACKELPAHSYRVFCRFVQNARTKRRAQVIDSGQAWWDGLGPDAMSYLSIPVGGEIPDLKAQVYSTGVLLTDKSVSSSTEGYRLVDDPAQANTALDRCVGVAEMRSHLTEYLDRVSAGEVVFVSRGKGQLPVAVVSVPTLCEVAEPERLGTPLAMAVDLYLHDVQEYSDPLLTGEFKARPRNRADLSQFNERNQFDDRSPGSDAAPAA